jgi:superoxide dismutase
MIAGTDLEGASVVEILRKAHGTLLTAHSATSVHIILTFQPSSPSPIGTNQGLFNNAAQSWNHAFYWDCMKPNGGGVATGKVAALIDKQFGSFDKFRAEFVTAGKSNCLPSNIITLKMTQALECE